MCSNMAPEVRIELTITESKSGVLPLHYSGTYGHPHQRTNTDDRFKTESQIFKEHTVSAKEHQPNFYYTSSKFRSQQLSERPY
jgi:hypothetical protein